MMPMCSLADTLLQGDEPDCSAAARQLSDDSALTASPPYVLAVIRYVGSGGRPFRCAIGPMAGSDRPVTLLASASVGCWLRGQCCLTRRVCDVHDAINQPAALALAWQ